MHHAAAGAGHAALRIVLQQAAAGQAVLHALRRQYTSECSMSSFLIDNMKRTLITEMTALRQLKI